MEATNGIKKLSQRIRANLQVCTCSAILTQLVLSPYALAEPTGGHIVGGSGSINQSALITTINQNSARLAIDWQTFNVNQNETVNFQQPDQSSIALNRILDQSPSQIHGAINANGQIVLVNPNGVFFSETATVNAGGLFASALDISTEDFMAGRLNFKALENTSGLIVNEGTLKVIDGGTLALIGQKIRNAGLLIANFGTVALAAGSDISVRFEDQTHTSITVNANTLAGILELDEPAIFNSGLIQAHGGRVVLTARQAQGIKASVANYDDTAAFSFDQGQVIEKDGVVYLTGPDGDIADLGEIDVSNERGDAGEVAYTGNNINHSGSINADSVQGKGGKVSFDANDTTLLTDNSVVSAQSAEQVGGTVHVLGNHVGLTDKTSINVSGAQGGGEVLIGGDYQGKNSEVKNAEAVYLGGNTSVTANASENGDGGKIIVWSDKVTRAYGALSATGGEQSGDGGFIETSSHDYVDLSSTVDVHAENGKHGEWLIDPTNISIQATGSPNVFENPADIFTANGNNSSVLRSSTLEAALASGADITVQTAVILTNTPFGCTLGVDCVLTDLQSEGSPYPGYSRGGTITLATDLDFNGAATTSSLTLNAHRNIIIDGNITDSVAYDPPDGSLVQNSLNLTLNADWAGDATAGTSPTGVGSITINAGKTINLQGGDFTASGVNFTNNGTIDTTTPSNYTVTTPGGNADITATAGSIGGAGNLLVAGTTTLNAASSINLNSTTNDFQDVVTINRGTSVLIQDVNNLTVNINNASVSSIATNTGGNSFITDIDTNGTVLGAMTVGNNLDVTSAGGIRDSATLTDVISVNGTSTFRVAAGSNIILDNNNNFNSTVQFLVNGGVGNINNLNIRDTSAFDLQDITVDGFLTASSGGELTVNDITLTDDAQALSLTSTGGDVTQVLTNNSAIVRTGTGDNVLSATGDINLNAQPNNINKVSITQAGTASVDNGANAIVLNGVTATSLNVKAAGGISETGVLTVGGLTTLDAGINNVVLNTNNHNLNNVQIVNAGNVSINENDDINISGNMSSLDLLAGIAVAGSTISNVQNSVLTVTGTSTLGHVFGGSVNMDNFTEADLSLRGRNSLQGAINITTIAGSIGDLSIRNNADILLSTPAITNNLNLATTAAISQSLTGGLVVAGATSLQAASINLSNSLNDFNAITISNAATALITDLDDVSVTSITSGDITINADGLVSVEGDMNNLSVTTTGGVNSGVTTLSVGSNTNINATTAGNVDFNTNQVNLENLNILLANDVLINEINNLVVTDATVNGTLDIAATDTVSVNGNIANLAIDTGNTISLSGTLGTVDAVTTAGGIQNGAAALTVIDTATLDAGNSDVILNNGANDIASIGIVNAQDVSLSDANALQLMDITSTTLTVNTRGDLSQAAGTVLDVSGLTDLNSGNANINLDQANLLTSLVLRGNNVMLVNDQSLMLNNSVLQTSVNVSTTTGNLSLQSISAGTSATFTAADAIIDANAGTNNITAANVSLNAVNGIGMGSVGNDNTSHINIRAANLSAHNSGTGDINLVNFGDDITLVSIVNDATDRGNFNFESTHDVFIDNITLQQSLTEEFYSNGSGTVNIRTAEGSFLGVGGKDINNPDITATNLRLIGIKGTLGTLQRPLVLDISGKVELLMHASLDPVYVEPVPIPDIDIHDDSLLKFTSADTLAAANGVQLTEVETLLDIDPAIFTELRHFVVDADPVLLPRDQRFDVENEDEEEDEQYFRRISGEGEVLVN